MSGPPPEVVTAGRWTVARWRGEAAAFHALALPETVVPTVWLFEVERPALVLGSGQPERDVDLRLAESLGVAVVRRRSGGGAVLLWPGDVVWADFLLPATDPLWAADIGVAPRWVGELWGTVLQRFGLAAVVHRGGLLRTPWSPRACFAGLGPGEVTVGGRKIVGISQRRARAGARFQTALALRWAPEPLAQLMGMSPEEAAAIAPCAVGLAELVPPPPAGAEGRAGGLADDVVGTLLAALAAREGPR